MAEAFVNVTEGSGKKLHAFDRVIAANTVLDEGVFLGEFPYPTYNLSSGATSIATAAAHVLQLMAGASLNVRIRRVRVNQVVNATTAAVFSFALFRLTTAGTGGGAQTPAKFDNAAAAAGATGMTLPTAKGTEGVAVFEGILPLRQTVATAGAQDDATFEWIELPQSQPIIIPAGTANGVALKVTSAGHAGATAVVQIEFVETAFAS